MRVGFGDGSYSTDSGTGINTSAIPVSTPTPTQAAAVNPLQDMPLTSYVDSGIAAGVFTAPAPTATASTCPTGYACTILPSYGIPDIAVYAFGGLIAFMVLSSFAGGRRR